MNKNHRARIFQKFLVTILILSIIAAIIGPIFILLRGLGLAHEPLTIGMIIENTDTLEEISVSGNGSINNPYVIRNQFLGRGFDIALFISSIEYSITIKNCIFQGYNEVGIMFEDCTGEITFIDNFFGGLDARQSIISYNIIDFETFPKFTIINNIFNDEVYIHSAHSSILANNTFIHGLDDREYSGLSISYSNNTIISNNTFSGCGLEISDWYEVLSYKTFYEIENNTVNGLPLQIISSKSNLDIDLGESGQLILKNCTNIYAKNADIKNTKTAVLLINSNNCSFHNVKFNFNYIGLKIYESSRVHINECQFFNNEFGLLIDISYDVYVEGCFFHNRLDGIRINAHYDDELNDDSELTALIHNNTFLCHGNAMLIYDFNCIITNNHIEGSQWGAILIHGNNNTIYSNLFINNNEERVSQAYDYGEENIWFDSKNKIGNNWSDWKGEGSYNIDGDANSTDPYPSAIQNPKKYSYECYIFTSYKTPILENPFFIFFMIDGSIFTTTAIAIIYIRKSEKQVNNDSNLKK